MRTYYFADKNDVMSKTFRKGFGAVSQAAEKFVEELTNNNELVDWKAKVEPSDRKI